MLSTTKIRNNRNTAQDIQGEELRKSVAIPGLLEDILMYEDYLKISFVIVYSRLLNQKCLLVQVSIVEQYFCIIQTWQ